MKEIDTKEYKNILLVVLKDIDSFCKANSIAYYLDSGTLLGAIRHDGYIPWDDDIDLVMPRKDYERFISTFHTELCSVMCFQNNRDYYYQYAKVNYKKSVVEEVLVPKIAGLGINVDVFPLDGMPNFLLLRRCHQDLLMGLSKLRTMIIVLRKKLPSVLKPVLRWRWIVKCMDGLAKKYDFGKTQYCGNIVATSVRHKEIPANCFQETKMHVFEGEMYPIPSGYDLYLHLLYGDYMKLPPEEKQIQKHHIKAYIED